MSLNLQSTEHNSISTRSSITDRGMPLKKRPYVPKTKGCYQCARRRIHCDRTGPQCVKCKSRGLKCTGLGVEIVLDCDTTSVPTLTQPEVFTEPSLWTVSHDQHREPHPADPVEAAPPGTYHGQLHVPTTDNDADDLGNDSLTGQLDNYHGDVDDVDETIFIDNRLLLPLPEHVPLWQRNLCLNFSKSIAFEMVTVDGPDNSWRHLVLPFAYQDELVMSAVLAVSAFHQHLVNSPRLPIANASLSESQMHTETLESFPLDLHKLDQAVVSGLKKHLELSNSDPARNQSVLITILVLQVGAMVTGRSDFPSLYRMLNSAFDAIGGQAGLGDGDAPEFIMSQVDKFRFYGAPFIDEEAGLKVISSPSHAGRLLDCLSRRWTDHPEHRQTVHFVNDLVRQALDMYLDQAWFTSEYESGGDPSLSSLEASYRMERSIIRVEHYIETLKALLSSPIGASCEQVLIWATFVAASSCMLSEHIQFFEGVFLRHYARCGFLNVLVGLETLRKIWSRQNTSERWTSLMAQTKKLVM